MKYLYASLLLCMIPLSIDSRDAQSCELSIQCPWEELPGSQAIHTQLGKHNYVEKQYAVITFKKRTPEKIILQELGLQWKGENRIEVISASLFKKDPNKKLLPLVENLVSEAYWNKEKQQLYFEINNGQGEPLETVTSFCIVLTVDKELEKTVEKGQFLLISSSLPEPFQYIAQTTSLVMDLQPKQKYPARNVS